MWLINTITLKLEEFTGSKIPPYAILSHRWEDEEVLFKDIEQKTHTTKRGWHKIIKCCEQAQRCGLRYAWVDTCCIDKTSSAELSEAINSMFKWYENSDICYAYLSDVNGRGPHPNGPLPDAVKQELEASVWFLRGWTLQELVAPEAITFFDCSWQVLGTKSSLAGLISQITSIPEEVLVHKQRLTEIVVAQRMSWAANRQTTREEDRAYSLMGIFGVNMPMLYGEGRASFTRLQEEILKRSADESLLLWDGAELGLLAPTPDAFRMHLPRNHRDLQVYSVADNEIKAFGSLRLHHSRERTSMGLTNIGLSITLDLIPWYPDVYLALPQIRRPYYQRLGSRANASHVQDGRLGIFLRRSEHDSRLFRIKFQHESVECLPERTWGPLFKMKCPQNPFMDPSGHISRQVVVAFEPGTNINEFPDRRIPLASLSLFRQSFISIISRLVTTPGSFEVLAVIRIHKEFFTDRVDRFVYVGFDDNFRPFLVSKVWHLADETFEDIHQRQSDRQRPLDRQLLDKILSASHFLTSVRRRNVTGEIVRELTHGPKTSDIRERGSHWAERGTDQQDILMRIGDGTFSIDLDNLFPENVDNLFPANAEAMTRLIEKGGLPLPQWQDYSTLV